MIKIFIAILALVSIAQDLLIRHRLKKIFPSKKWLPRAYLISFLCIDGMVVAALTFYRTALDTESPYYIQGILWGIGIFIMTIVPKLIYLLVSLLDYPFSRLKKRPVHWFSMIGAVAGMCCLAVMIWGSTQGRNRIRVNEITITSNKLPEAFDGYRIVMFSDLHTGNYGPQNTLIDRMAKKINSLEADLVVNGGDLVNTNAHELRDKDMAALGSIRSRDGVYSVFGNHDLGFYMRNQPGYGAAESVQLLAEKQAGMGWRLLDNESEIIRRGGDSIVVSGVNYPRDGFHNGQDTGLGGCDLEATYRNVTDSAFNLMISHTPQNWDTIRATGKADLTLSGHVHAMQLKLRIGKWMWSPAKWMYPRWSGLYTEGNQHLYINDGMGYVMYPMRIGTYPELTVITLRTNAQVSDRSPR